MCVCEETCTKLGAGFPAIAIRDEEAYNVQHRVLGDGPDRGASATRLDAVALTIRVAEPLLRWCMCVCESGRA